MGLYTTSKSQEALRELLVGKTIRDVRFPPITHLLCEFVFEPEVPEGDPETLMLFATGLGFWTGKPDSYYYTQDPDGTWRQTTDAERDIYFEEHPEGIEFAAAMAKNMKTQIPEDAPSVPEFQTELPEATSWADSEDI